MNRINLNAVSLFNDLIKTIQSKHVCFCSAERKEKMASNVLASPLRNDIARSAFNAMRMLSDFIFQLSNIGVGIGSFGGCFYEYICTKISIDTN